MTRVICLFDSRAGFQTRRCAEALERGLRGECAVEPWTLGPGGRCRDVPAAVRSLRADGGTGLVHAWGSRALTAAALGARDRIVYSPISCSSSDMRLLRAAMAHRDVRVVCHTATMLRRLAVAGIDPARCELVRPGVDFARCRAVRNESLRAALGFAPDDRVGLAVGEGGHQRAMWAVGILHELDSRYKLVVRATGESARRARTALDSLGARAWVRLADGSSGMDAEFEDFLTVADYALVGEDEGAEPLALCACMAAGVPVVAAAGYEVCELVEDRHTALLAGEASPAGLAGRTLMLFDDADLRLRIIRAARAEAYEHYRLTMYLDGMRRVYGDRIGGRRIPLAQAIPSEPEALA